MRADDYRRLNAQQRVRSTIRLRLAQHEQRTNPAPNFLERLSRQLAELPELAADDSPSIKTH